MLKLGDNEEFCGRNRRLKGERRPCLKIYYLKIVFVDLENP